MMNNNISNNPDIFSRDAVERVPGATYKTYGSSDADKTTPLSPIIMRDIPFIQHHTHMDNVLYPHG